MLTLDTIIRKAQAFTATTEDTAISAVWQDALLRADMASYAKHVVAYYVSEVRTVTATANLLDCSTQNVSRMNRGVKAWLATGLDESAVKDSRRPWTLVKSMLKHWDTEEGKADLKALAAMEDDASRLEYLFAIVPGAPQRAEDSPEKAFLKALAAALAIAEGEGFALTSEGADMAREALAALGTVVDSQVPVTV